MRCRRLRTCIRPPSPSSASIRAGPIARERFRAARSWGISTNSTATGVCLHAQPALPGVRRGLHPRTSTCGQHASRAAPLTAQARLCVCPFWRSGSCMPKHRQTTHARTRARTHTAKRYTCVSVYAIICYSSCAIVLHAYRRDVIKRAHAYNITYRCDVTKHEHTSIQFTTKP